MTCKSFHNLIKRISKIVETSVSAFAFLMAIGVVIYMLLAFGLEMWNFFVDLPHVLSIMTAADYSAESMAKRHYIEIAILHTVAFAVLLIKVYRILISYAKTQHLNIKFLVEIAIIASAIEILFNSHSYSYTMLAIFGVFGIANLIIYVWKFEEFKKIGNDHG